MRPKKGTYKGRGKPLERRSVKIVERDQPQNGVKTAGQKSTHAWLRECSLQRSGSMQAGKTEEEEEEEMMAAVEDEDREIHDKKDPGERQNGRKQQ